MKKKMIFTLNVGDQEYEDMEGEGSRDDTATTVLLYSEADRCPICLNCLLEKEVGFPENCNHVFCMPCILKWAETLASCPIDRKPFQAVFKFSALGGCIKVQIQRQSEKTKDKKNESFFKKQLSCHESSKNCIRQKAIVTEALLSAKFYDLKMLYRNSSYSETREKKNGIIKINKPRRSNCTNQCFRNVFSNIFSSSTHTGESSNTHRSYSTEFLEVNEISAVIRQKRQELEMSWFRDTLPGIGRNDFIPWNIETEILPLGSSVLPRTVFPTSTIALENFGTSCKGYALAHTQEGEEKKQTSGTSNTRGSRRKPAATTPTRRSARNMRSETVSQAQRSPVSATSGCDAPDSNNASVSVSSSAESEKQTRQAPKRKSVRRGRKPPLLKKKLRSSVPPPEKSSSSESADEETAESDPPPVLQKEPQSDIGRSNTCVVQAGEENKSANDLRSCSEHIDAQEEHIENPDTEETAKALDSNSYAQDPDPEETIRASYSESYSQDPDPEETIRASYSESYSQDPDPEEPAKTSDCESYSQDPPVLLKEGTSKKIEITGIENDVMCVESDISKDTGERGGDLMANQDQVSEPLELEVKTDKCTDHPANDFHTISGFEIEVHQPVSSPVGEVLKNVESVVKEEKNESPVMEIVDHKDATVEIEELLESPKLNSPDGESIQTRNKSDSSEVQLTQHVETEHSKLIAKCDGLGNENFNSTQESENNLLKNDFDNTKLGHCLEEKTESPDEHPTSEDLPNTHSEEIQKHFSEDNNETIPMECDSFCSDQSEAAVGAAVNADAKQLTAKSVEHSSENNTPPSDPASGKVETVCQPSEGPAETADKGKKPRSRRSRFHSPSTTWSPATEPTREKKRSQSPSPKKQTGKESRRSQSPSPKKEPARGRRKSRSQSPKKDSARERRRSPSRSPKKESSKEGKQSDSVSPKRDMSGENRRSQSRVKESSPREKSRSRSRERESDREGQRRDRDRERRARRWSRSRSRSRSPSRSRTKSKSSSFGRNDRDNYSPRWKERWTNDGWRCPRGNDRYRKSDSEKQNENTRKEKNDISPDADDLNSDKRRNDCPNWVTEKINSGPDPRTRNPEKVKDTHWEENRNENSGNSWNKNLGSSWMSNRGRGNRGRGTYRGGFAYTDQSENRWQNRKPLSGNSNSSGNEPFKFAEQQPYKRKNEHEFSFDTPADRSGWTSASSWAVRKTLPADVQNYYSRRGRASSGPQSGWMRQEEEATAEQDSNLKDQTNQQGDGSQLPINMIQPQVNVMQQQMNAQHQPMNIFPYPVGVHAPLMNIQRNPFNMHPPLPLHLHTGVPVMQVAAPASVSQGPPPPPPPPPPSQQVNYIASQPDGKQLQGIPSASHVSNNMNAPVLPAPTAAPGSMGTVQGPSSGNTSSSSHSTAANAAVKLAESKKLQIQEKAAQEVKLAIKPFYQNKDITKEEYKEIVRKAVDKVCHSKSGEVNATKVANLVKAYVDKYKYSRKGSQKKSLEEPGPTDKAAG
ncbi:protein SCAF11 isoform X2 [Echinops telfairi]|uniref:Protein SCAF11 isoform X2 n=1 Tax=Echinops telfairi TaxID=9371 RepID=A0AC55CUL0_ECHTE|nr:protein SCAF11 isoform X2 [Echinops telfairi]